MFLLAGTIEFEPVDRHAAFPRCHGREIAGAERGVAVLVNKDGDAAQAGVVAGRAVARDVGQLLTRHAEELEVLEVQSSLVGARGPDDGVARSAEDTSVLQSLTNDVCRLLLEEKDAGERPTAVA